MGKEGYGVWKIFLKITRLNCSMLKNNETHINDNY